MVFQISMACLQRDRMLSRRQWSCRHGGGHRACGCFGNVGKKTLPACKWSYRSSTQGAAAVVVAEFGVQGSVVVYLQVEGEPGFLALSTVQVRMAALGLAFGTAMLGPPLSRSWDEGWLLRRWAWQVGSGREMAGKTSGER